MSGAITLLPLYALMVWRGTTLPLPLLTYTTTEEQVLHFMCNDFFCGFVCFFYLGLKLKFCFKRAVYNSFLRQVFQENTRL
jgi:hypothetical protein